MARKENPSREILKAKTARAAKILENYLGIPTPAKRKTDPLDMLIATLLSQNTNDRNSHQAYQNLRKTFPTWEDVLQAPTKKLADVIRVGGMANQKSARIKNILKSIKKQYGKFNLNFLKKMDNDQVYQTLLSFKGVGLKTAACVLVFSFGRDVFPVDTHIHRICNRLGLVLGCKTPEKTFHAMQEIVPEGKAYSFHTNLIRFGRKVCKAQNPLCGICPLFKQCVYEKKNPLAGLTSTTQKDYNFMLLDNV